MTGVANSESHDKSTKESPTSTIAGETPQNQAGSGEGAPEFEVEDPALSMGVSNDDDFDEEDEDGDGDGDGEGDNEIPDIDDDLDDSLYPGV